jgi:hypothetical protein
MRSVASFTVAMIKVIRIVNKRRGLYGENIHLSIERSGMHSNFYLSCTKIVIVVTIIIVANNRKKHWVS